MFAALEAAGVAGISTSAAAAFGTALGVAAAGLTSILGNKNAPATNVSATPPSPTPSPRPVKEEIVAPVAKTIVQAAPKAAEPVPAKVVTEEALPAEEPPVAVDEPQVEVVEEETVAQVASQTLLSSAPSSVEVVQDSLDGGDILDAIEAQIVSTESEPIIPEVAV